MLLSGKVAIITGATRGIGKGILQAFAEAGATCIGIYASSDREAELLQSQLTEQGHKVQFYKGSISDRAFVAEMMASVAAEHGRLDILVNNAGIVRDNISFQMTEDEWEAVYRTNFLGTYVCSLQALEYMVPQKYGKIVNIVSVTGVLGREAQSNYGASKGSVMGLTRLLARKYAADGIYVNAVAPGMINTEMIGHVPQAKLENFLRFTTQKRLGETEEIANSVLFLASDMSNYLSNIVLNADGGFLR
jgi:3-oxoacyl-[acyl-carrier protein] reductase